jgi:putative DNA primase/helicase
MERPINRIIRLLQGIKPGADGSYAARCPAHDDRQQSLSIREGDDGRVLLHCFAGCTTEQIVMALGIEMSDLFPPREKDKDRSGNNRDRESGSSSRGITVDELARDKGLSAEYLKGHGVEQGIGGVKITYKLQDGSPAPRQRWRRALTAKEGSSWLKGDGPPVPYGLWLLSRMRQKSDVLTLVEGESDSWTLWYHHIPALGIPGADMVKVLDLPHVAEFPKLAIFVEPDKGGATFLARLTVRLKDLGYPGEVCSVRPLPGAKDPNDMFRQDPQNFPNAWTALMNRAEPVDLTSVPEPSSQLSLHAPPSSEAAALAVVNLTDLGNARRLVRRHGQDLRYCHPWEKWMIWDGLRWVKDASGEIGRRTKDTVAAMYAEASELSDDRERQELAKHAMRSESDSRLRAMVHQAKDEPGIPVMPEDFDPDPWLLNVENGILDLRTGGLLPHTREAMMSKALPVSYDPQAACPLWLTFLDRIMKGNERLISYLQRITGYALTGDTSEQCLFMFYGTGANGKSTFLQTLKEMFGDYGCQADFTTFLHSDQDKVRNDIAELMGRRFVAAIEADAGRRLAEVLVKQITGGDTVKARFLFREFFEFKPAFKVFLAANSKPTIRGQDYAIWRRIRLVPFEVTIPEAEKDKNLGAKLLKELPGILAWAVEGCKDWQAGGLADPSEVLNATQSYREEMDILAAFVAECCALSKTAETTTKALYGKYLEWCGENTEKPLSKNAFSTRLKEKGFENSRIGHGQARGWLGIGLVDAVHQDLGMREPEIESKEQGAREAEQLAPDNRKDEREPF